MYSTVSDDMSRVHLALEATKCLKNISTNTQNLTALHRELLEINLSVTTYVEESKRRLEGLRSQLAHEAKSSQRVVEVLSEKLMRICFQNTMSKTPASPMKHKKPGKIKKFTVSKNKDAERHHQNANTFVTWYRNMIDNERQNFSLYLADDASLEWFGRTIKTRRKISAFLNHDMQCTRHDFTSVEIIEKIQSREEKGQREDDTVLASPLHSPELVRSKLCKRKRSRPLSPEWAEGCQPKDEDNGIIRKRPKVNHTESMNVVPSCEQQTEKRASNVDGSEICNNGDGMKRKDKCVLVTPPNVEIGQGDCLPSTSGTNSEKFHETLNAQLPRLAVECNGFIEFTRSRNSRSIDSMKWERKCKVQISYSDDPLNVGEYIIWAIRYHDENRCRRNLLDAFEKVLKEEKI